MTIPDTFAALKDKRIKRGEAIELLIPELDRLLAFDLIPVVGGVVEAISDQLLRPGAAGMVDGMLRRWAKEARAKK